MRVIGTAGHVDHGKSSLVQALTGIHPDRLKEEQERQMTIDLGFAWMTLPPSADLPAGEEIGIVDVPGHRDFIENMLAGVGGIDLALLVIAADEGVMPQTREHLAILDLLQVEAGVVALTKTDLTPDEEWLALVEEEIRRLLQPTTLREAPIVRVSARTGQGIAELKQALSASLAKRLARPDLGRPRLPVDRAFTIAGFGTVVTGTLMDGTLRIGDEVEILAAPQGTARGRVRGLQTHKRKTEAALPGSRTAVNIAGVTLDQVQRGAVVAHPGDYHPTRRLDVHFRLLKEVRQPLHHNLEVKLFIGAAEVPARLRLLGREELPPGEEAWLQLELADPVVAVRGDHYILRRPSPGETLGGGVVVDADPPGRHKRFAAATLDRLQALATGDPAAILLQTLLALGVAPLQEVIQRSRLEPALAEQTTATLIRQGQALLLEEAEGAAMERQALVAHRAFWEGLSRRLLGELADYHRLNPLRSGIPKEELKSRLRLDSRLFNALLRFLLRQGQIVEKGAAVAMQGFVVRLTPEQQTRVERLLAKFAAAPTSPPTVKECVAEIGEDLYNTLIEQGELAPVSAEVVFRKADYEAMVQEVIGLIQANGAVTAAQVRDHFNTSRRYVLALLEHLDGRGITVRQGDFRRLRRQER